MASLWLCRDGYYLISRFIPLQFLWSHTNSFSPILKKGKESLLTPLQILLYLHAPFTAKHLKSDCCLVSHPPFYSLLNFTHLSFGPHYYTKNRSCEGHQWPKCCLLGLSVTSDTFSHSLLLETIHLTFGITRSDFLSNSLLAFSLPFINFSWLDPFHLADLLFGVPKAPILCDLIYAHDFKWDYNKYVFYFRHADALTSVVSLTLEGLHLPGLVNS